MKGGKGYYLLVLCILLSLFQSGCKSGYLKDAEPETVPPVAGFAPRLNSDRVFVQSYDVNQQKAVAVGLTGAAAVGVTEICVELVDGSRTCFPANTQDGSFRGLLDGAKPGDIVKLWGNGPTYLPGGPGNNDIEERVQYWKTRFPERITAFFKAFDRLYVGTEEGLWFFPNADLTKDPATLYPLKYDLQDGLPDTHIRALVTDGGGGLWIGTQFGGVSHLTFDPNGIPVFTNYVKTYARSLLFGPNGCLWIGTSGAGLRCLSFDALGAVQYKIYTAQSSYLPNNVILALAQDRPSSFWVGTEGGLSHVEIQIDQTLHFTNYGQGYGFLPNNIVQSLAVDSTGTLWAGTKNGLCKITLSGSGQPISFVTETTAEGLPDNDIRSLSRDDGSGLWIGTNYEGLSHRTFRSDGSGSFQNEAGFLHDNIRAVLNDGSGSAWVGTLMRGFAHYSWSAAQGTQIKNYFVAGGLPSNTINSIVPDPAGGFLIGTGSGLSKMTFDSEGEAQFVTVAGQDELPQAWVTSLARAPSGALWIGTKFTGGITQLSYDGNGSPTFSTETTAEGLVSDEVTSLFVESEQSLWIGTLGGLSHRKVTMGSVSFENYKSTNSPLAQDYIQAVSSDLCGGVWIGHLDQGLTHLTFDVGGKPVFQSYTLVNGLEDDDVLSLFPVACNEVWAGTSNGLSLVKIVGGSAMFTNYSNKSGANGIGNQGVIRSILSDGMGGLWLGTGGGFTHAKLGLDGIFTFERFSAVDGLPSTYIQAMVPFSQDSFLLGTDAGLILFRP